jgi:hypothetical protein
MIIQTKSEIKLNKSQEEINLVLQEDISINSIDLKPINDTNLFN